MSAPTISPIVLARSAADAALDAGFAKADELGVPFTIAVLDGGGNLVAQVRGDGAALASIGTSVAKALTAVHFAQPTQDLQGAVTPGQPFQSVSRIDRVAVGSGSSLCPRTRGCAGIRSATIGGCSRALRIRSGAGLVA